MTLAPLLGTLREHTPYRNLINQLRDGQHPDQGLGLIRSARPYTVAALAKDANRPLLVITPRINEAENLAEQLLAWAPDLEILSFAEPNAMFYEHGEWGPRARKKRLDVLARLSEGIQPGTVIVTAARALMQRTLPPDYLTSHAQTISVGKRIPGGQPDKLLHHWLHIGYEPMTVVTEAGTFSRRGGILDIFPVTATRPVRIELWGDDVESIRTFEPATQRSLQSIESIHVPPAREALPQYGLVAAAKLKKFFAGLQDADDESTSVLWDEWLSDQKNLTQQLSFDALEFYIPWMYDQSISMLDYLPDDMLVCVDEWAAFADTVADLEAQAISLYDARTNSGSIPADMPLPYITWGHIEDALSRSSSVELGGSPSIATGDESPPLGDSFLPGNRFGGELARFMDHLKEITRGERDRVVVVSRQAERLAELWQGRVMGDHRPVLDNLDTLPPGGPPTFVQGALQEGWQFAGDTSDVTLLTDSEIFGWRRPEPRRRRQPRAIAPEEFFADLKPGDYVVHVEHGIGQFMGLDKRNLGGIEREFLMLAYEGGSALYVPIHQADRITRYVGSSDAAPGLSKLGTQNWNQVKERTQRAVEEIAADLLDLYAARESVIGHAFSPDGPWQAELEASFPYIETDDQLKALREVKADMEKSRPMDRLICGDVGYGKTEVALRAAFKAVMDGKQVAILVPTTVLAQQHYETFRQRLAAFPITVEMLSRFRTSAEQSDIIQKATIGGVDILIGTHRLLSNDVHLPDLGLLIIDEEQRFGVTHKEQLKRLRTEVDVLTLTATPIPRTLYMGLTGVRDISIINTAPEERLPIRTYVGKRDDDLIREAILRELDRGGQVFFVHNRVQTIYTQLKRLERIVPEAACAVGHGQMNEHQLEAVMRQFSQGEIDVLLSTSIIEAGLDIPNANTLIVDRADWFGLAQLYQLRGRVGRSANRAFAYFFHPPTHKLTNDALARLETIGEHTELGAGLNIAMRDLELRGAGDILGVRQSGQIAAVGFHLYTQMLAQAVKRLKLAQDEDAPALTEEDAAEILGMPAQTMTIDLPIPTYIPTDYIAELSLRIKLYRRMGDTQSLEDIDILGEELADRFGPIPPPLMNLLYQLRVKQYAILAGVDAVTTEGKQISLRMRGLAHVDRRALQQRLGHDVRVSRPAIWLPQHDGWEASLIDILQQLSDEPVGVQYVTDG